VRDAKSYHADTECMKGKQGFSGHKTQSVDTSDRRLDKGPSRVENSVILKWPIVGNEGTYTTSSVS
jgi:hypothetical protein